jgi:type II secretory ATPase GspE/PulE/Tfp pilus assembly ATPase PilB-like protein
VGCPKCRKTGYSGRIGIYELVLPDEAMRDKLTSSPNVNELRALAVQSGMVQLRDDGMAKVKAGITTVEEVFRVTAA